jgi:hypothetical protein
MELEPATILFQPVADERPRLAPPPPAQLVAIADVRLAAVAGQERELDAFYAGLLQLQRDPGQETPGHCLVYRAKNASLRLEIHERPPRREDFRPLGVMVPSLANLAGGLTERNIEFVRQRGIFAGIETLLFNDPAGNPVEAIETRAFF